MADNDEIVMQSSHPVGVIQRTTSGHGPSWRRQGIHFC